MNPAQRYRVLDLEPTKVAIHDKEENTVLIFEGEITSDICLTQRRKKEAEPVPTVDPRQITIDDTAFVDSFDPDPDYAGKPLR